MRDTDSRLNARERFAVEEWIQSGKGVHSIRDHPNHERPLNGGLWGGTKGAVQGMTKLVKNFSNKGKYGLDLTFLNEKVWPTIKHNQMSVRVKERRRHALCLFLFLSRTTTTLPKA